MGQAQTEPGAKLVPMITRSRLADLPAEERSELEAILAEARTGSPSPPRFQSNADEASFVFYALFMGALIGIIAYLAVFGNPFAQLDDLFVFGFNPRWMIANPTLGVLALFPLAGYSLWRIIANFRGNGWALTSFGFVHLYRDRVRIVRFADITHVTVRSFRRGKSITLVTRDGAKLQSYASALLPGLLQRVPPGTKIVEL